ncbi:hypothetical protein LOY90_005148 [Ophidiomyces ophidiicola]|nr:hypothetical protein LOY90_005148 [Ophidiomyces ophidiicola]
MTMVMESGSRQYGGLSYDNVYHSHGRSNPPHFNESWPPHSAAHPAAPVYQSAVAGNPVAVKREDVSRPPTLPVSYPNPQVPAPSMVPNGNYSNVGYGGAELVVLPTELPRTTFEQPPPQQPCTSAPQMAPFTPANYSSLEYAQSLHLHQQHQHQQQHQHPQPQQQQQPQQHPSHMEGRAVHHANDPSPHVTQPQQVAYNDALDASRGMVALSQDLTPRAIYGPRSSRGSVDSYGFPTPHSSASSISSGGTYPYYSASVVSVDSSVTDYSSTASDSYDGLSRTLPRPSGLVAGALPPQSMMGQFNSKVPSNTQKKHKCKVCDKRFTRPSSLQTHMYSHTGEKRKFSEINWNRGTMANWD